MYILYGGDYTRSMLVQWVLEEGGIEYEFRKIDILKGEHRTDEFLAINPAGFVPVLVTPEGDVLYEAAAMMLYLADRHGLADLAPPVGHPDRGRFLSALFHISGEIQSEMKRLNFPHRFSLRREDDAGIQELARTFVLDRLAIMDGRLAKLGPYSLGAQFSLVDFCLIFWVVNLGRADACGRFPRVARLYELVRMRPRITRYLAAWETMIDEYWKMRKANPGSLIPRLGRGPRKQRMKILIR